MLLGKLFQSKLPALLKALLPKDLQMVFRTANRSLKFIKWIDPFDTNILNYTINNGVANPLLCVERGVRQGGSILPFYSSLALSSNRIKVITGLEKYLNSTLPIGQVTLKFCLPGALPHLPRFSISLIIHEFKNGSRT